MGTLYYNLHIQVLQELRNARKNVWSDCETSSWLKREERWRRGLCDSARNNSEDRRFAPSACCPADRPKLVPAIGHHCCCTLNLREMQCSPHDILPQWQRDITETRVSKSRECHKASSRPSNCLPWWVNKMKIWLRHILFILSFLPTFRKRPIFHSTREYYICISYAEKVIAYQISTGHPYQKNMEKFFYLHV